MTKPLILVGGGGHCKSVIDIAECAAREIKGILDLPDTVGSKCLSYEVIGTDDDIPKYASGCEFLITLGFIGDPQRRKVLSQLIRNGDGQLAILESPKAHISAYAQVGEGTVICHNVSVNADARIGRNCILNTACNIEHDVVLGDNVHVSTGAMLNGGVYVGSDVFIGSGAVICNGVHITDGCVIGAGCVVTKDIEQQGTYVGVPARKV
ncbi:MAG: acetyltransferase [Bacteroidales bacterium]|nr:acetyltransferase [Bacteroidales bacterium]